MYRQGDVLIVPIEKIPRKEKKKEIPREDGKIILAKGEATGHHHAIASKHAQLYQVGAMIVLSILKECYVEHQEHGKIELPTGDYKVVRQREYFPEEIRYVQD